MSEVAVVVLVVVLKQRGRVHIARCTHKCRKTRDDCKVKNRERQTTNKHKQTQVDEQQISESTSKGASSRRTQTQTNIQQYRMSQ